MCHTLIYKNNASFNLHNVSGRHYKNFHFKNEGTKSQLIRDREIKHNHFFSEFVFLTTMLHFI